MFTNSLKVCLSDEPESCFLSSSEVILFLLDTLLILDNPQSNELEGPLLILKDHSNSFSLSRQGYF